MSAHTQYTVTFKPSTTDDDTHFEISTLEGEFLLGGVAHADRAITDERIATLVRTLINWGDLAPNAQRVDNNETIMVLTNAGGFDERYFAANFQSTRLDDWNRAVDAHGKPITLQCGTTPTFRRVDIEQAQAHCAASASNTVWVGNGTNWYQRRV